MHFVGVGVKVEKIAERLNEDARDFREQKIKNKLNTEALKEFQKASIGDISYISNISSTNDYIVIILNREWKEKEMYVREIQYVDIILYKNKFVNAMLEIFEVEVKPEDIMYISGSV